MPALYTRFRLAQVLGIDRNRVSRILANVPADGKDEGYPAWYLRTALPHIFARRRGALQTNPESMSPLARRRWYDGESVRRDVVSKACRLVPFDEFLQSREMLQQSVMTEIRRIPEILRERGYPERQIGRAREEIDNIEAMLDKLTS